MNATEFHQLVVEMELESVMLTMRQFTEVFGALNWRENSILEKLANSEGLHPLKLRLTALAEWLDAYEQGSATVEDWQGVMVQSTEVRRVADGIIHEAYNRDNPRWQAAKAVASLETSEVKHG